MKIPLPNLDDRRWADLVDEGRSLIPVFAPQWTDHNVHDPGITAIELLAWIAEMDLYQLNRISDRAKRKFLSLIGVVPYPPLAARTILSFALTGNPPGTLELPAGIEFTSSASFGPPRRFRTLETITIAPGQLVAVQSYDKKRFHNLADHLRKGQTLSFFGTNPEVGAELYLGFSQPWQQNEPVSLYLTFTGPRSNDRERARILEEAKSRQRACHPPPIVCGRQADQSRQSETELTLAQLPTRARVAWEVLTEIGGAQTWVPLDSRKQEVDDDTHALMLDGRILFQIPAPMAKAAIGQVESELYYVRCRFQAGVFDEAPNLRNIAFNGVSAEQSVPVSTAWTIAGGVTPGGPVPTPGKQSGIAQLQFTQGEISKLDFAPDDGDVPHFTVLAYQPATATGKGLLSVEAKFVGSSDGEPHEEITLAGGPVQESSLELFTLEQDGWRSWQQRNDFDSSARDDAHFLLNATQGNVTFGDGRKGRMPPLGALIFAAYRITQAQEGNLKSDSISELSDSLHNRAVLGNFEAVKNWLAWITNPIPADAGSAAEDLVHAQGRALALMGTSSRAVTLADYERLAKQTPGVHLARVTARANLHPAFPCWKAPGLITVIVVPSLPSPRPAPSFGLRRAVASYLQPRRIIGTRVEVVGPTYIEIAIRATVQSLERTNTEALQQRIVEAINEFLDPLRGGPEKTGWPFGRDVYRSEVLQVIDEVPGVDYVLAFEISADGCPPQCGNICIPPTALVVPGSHEIEVAGGEGVSTRTN